MIKLLILSANLGRGGAEKQLVNLLAYVSKEEVEIRLINVGRVRGEYWEKRILGLPIQYDCLGPGTGQIDRVQQVARTIRRWKPDIVWAWHFFTGLYALPSRWLGARFKLVQGVRNDADYLLSVHPWAFWLLRRADAYVCNTKMVSDQLRERDDRLPPGYVLPNSIELDSEVQPLKEKVFVIGFCGNIHPRKGIDIFIGVASRLLNNGFNGRFVVAGSGDPEPYRQQAERLNICHAVEFKSNVECRKEIRNYDLFVLSSRHEGCPNVLLEAMACGVPVVATNVGGVGEVVNHEAQGLLCKAESEDELASAILRMVNDQDLRHRCVAAARNALEKRTPEYIAANDFVRILKEIQSQ